MKMQRVSVVNTVLAVLVAVGGSAAIEILGGVAQANTMVGSDLVYLPSGGAVQAESISATVTLPIQVTSSGTLEEPHPRDYGSVGVRMPTEGSAAFSRANGVTLNLGTFNIVINPGSGLSGNPAALAAFNRAAALWASRISDPITVTIDGDMADLGGGGIIGSTSIVGLQTGYTTVRDAMVADASDEIDDAVGQVLPTVSEFSAYVPTGFSLSGYLAGAKANLKALGFTGLDEQFGVSDASVTFNSQFAFDYDNSDGVSPGMMDFETVAAHEIGHALGFISTVDTIDYYLHQGTTGAVAIYALDMFRFNDGTNDPETLAGFTTTARNFVTGGTRNTDQILSWGLLAAAELGMSTGHYTGDGRQASHWKDNTLSGTWLGVMDPTLGYGEMAVPVESDYRALDLIGYEISPIPEPSSLVLILLGAACLASPRRRIGR